MSLKGQSLGQVQINRMKANARCIIFDNGNIPSAAYAALGEVNLGLVPIKDLNTCLSKIDKTTRLVVLAGPFKQDTHGAFCRKVRAMPFGWSIGICLISREFEDRVLAARTRTRLNADICIPQSAPSPVISEHLSLAIDTRRPLSHHEGIPHAPALALDHLWERIQRCDYYGSLECPKVSEPADIRHSFQRIAQIAHPDRHRKWADAEPVIKKRISVIYLRLSEAHRVLTDPIKRATYDLCLKSGRSLRYEPSCLGVHIQEELDECETEQGRSAVLRSLDARMEGKWAAACKAMTEAIKAEPENQWLRARADAVQTVYRLCKQSGAA